MRTFDLAKRARLSDADELGLFHGELAYYREHNRYPVKLFGVPFTNIYKRINVQVLVTRACNLRCSFCIESGEGQRDDGDHIGVALDVLRQYVGQGIMPCLSITGGEPTLYPNRVERLIDGAEALGIKSVNINTNGFRLYSCRIPSWINVNLSRHAIEPVPMQITGHAMQCVLMQGGVDSVAAMMRYMNHYLALGASGFSFRGLTKREGAASQRGAVDVRAIADELATNSDFQFVQQKVGDHYIYEIYRYRGVPVRLVYSNFDVLRQFETDERARGDVFSRATVVNSDGAVYSGWLFDLNEIRSAPKRSDTTPAAGSAGQSGVR